MSEYYARINITVKDVNDWQKLKNLDQNIVEKANFKLEAERIVSAKTPTFVVSEWSCNEDALLYLVCDFVRLIGHSAIIVADTTNFDVDPYTYLVCYLGGMIKMETYSCTSDRKSNPEDPHYGEGKMWNFHSNTNISDIAGCISYMRNAKPKVRIYSTEKRFLDDFGITVV